MHIILLSDRQFINRHLAVQEASHQKMADGSTLSSHGMLYIGYVYVVYLALKAKELMPSNCGAVEDS